MTALPDRPAARLLVIDKDGRLLLFRFTPGDRAPFWATPGGRLKEGESFANAARRELFEETGIEAEPGEDFDFRTSEFTTFTGERVRAVERYFAIRADTTEIDTSGHTQMERECMREYRWWTAEELGRCEENYYPPDLPALLSRLMESAE